MDPVALWWSLAVLASGALTAGLAVFAMRAYEGTKP